MKIIRFLNFESFRNCLLIITVTGRVQYIYFTLLYVYHFIEFLGSNPMASIIIALGIVLTAIIVCGVVASLVITYKLRNKNKKNNQDSTRLFNGRNQCRLY